MAIVSFALVCLGSVLLSLSLRRHYRQVFSDESTYERRLWPLRVSGYACVMLAWWPCISLLGAPMGTVLWISMFALAAFAQGMVLTYGFAR